MAATKSLLIVAVVAVVIALGMFVFVTDAPAYAGTNAATCNNCHMMDAAYENWYHGGHERVTECVDCHLPHDNLIDYYFEKAKTGMHDVYAFSTGTTPVMIRAKPETKKIIQANCIRCHEDTVDAILMVPMPFDRQCWDCHPTMAHGQRGISLVPYQDSGLYPIK